MTTALKHPSFWQDEFDGYLDILLNGKMPAVKKFILKPKETAFEMPKSASILTVQAVGRDICLWAMIDERDKDLVMRRFAYFFTDQEIVMQPMEYIGTAIIIGEKTAEVHVFELLD